MSGGGTGRRIVVQVRFSPSLEPDGASSLAQKWAELAPPLFERATALGGRVVGFGDHFLAIDFPWDALYDAIDFLVDAPLFPELASGLAHGHMNLIYEGPRMALVTGEVMTRAAQLSELARPGEVLVEPSLVKACEGRLGSIGEAGKRPGRPEIDALILDPEHPFDSTSVPPSPSLNLPLEDFDFDVTTRVRAEQAARLAVATEAVGRESDSTFPVALAQALKDRSPEALAKLAERVNASPVSPATERLFAMTELLQGRSGDAIRRLREARDQGEDGSASARCRATLALAVAYAAVGRTREAILEGLAGLARAREGQDEKGERACARFLANMAEATSDLDSAAAWNALCH
jgi:hypothetical protein